MFYLMLLLLTNNFYFLFIYFFFLKKKNKLNFIIILKINYLNYLCVILKDDYILIHYKLISGTRSGCLSAYSLAFNTLINLVME